MMYLKQKIKLYREITGITYPELAALLNTPMASLHYLLNKSSTTPDGLHEKFNQLLTQVREHHLELDKELQPKIKISTFWPELYAPFMYGVSHIVPKNGVWFFVKEGNGVPVYKDGNWSAIREGSPTLWALPVAPLPSFLIPEWPLLDEYGCLKQAENGWEKTISLCGIIPGTSYLIDAETQRYSQGKQYVATETLKLYGRWHIPGNSETSEFQQVVEDYYRPRTL